MADGGSVPRIARNDPSSARDRVARAGAPRSARARRKSGNSFAVGREVFLAYGIPGGGTRRFVACSNAYASAISCGSLHAPPVKLTP